MSIPNPFRPVCGAAARKPSGYVEDGLVYWLDVLVDGTGARSELTELVSAGKVPCQKEDGEPPIVGNDGVMRGSMAISFGDFVASQDYYVELVACPWEKRLTLGAFATKISEEYNSKFPQVGFDGKQFAFASQDALGPGTWTYLIPEERRERVSTFVFPSATAAPKCEGNFMNISSGSGSVQSRLVNCEDARFCALRIYNRQLSVSEAAQNLARDAERWNKNTIIV